MKKTLTVFAAIAVLWPAAALAQTVSVTAPASNVSLKSAQDFATRAFQDPWDMSQKSDVGPFLGSNDTGTSGWSSTSFSSGLFTGTTSASDAQLWLLDTGNPNAAPIGKTGTNYPIDASTYKLLSVRMNVPVGKQAFVYSWSKTIYDSSYASFAGRTTAAGWNVYLMDLSSSSSWTGTQRALRLDPAEGAATGTSISVDWTRLVDIDTSLCKMISWSGGVGADSSVDIYLDNDKDVTNGYIGLLEAWASPTNTAAHRSSPGCSAQSGGYNFYTGALPAGTYYVFLTPLNVAPSSSTAYYAPGSWTINETPTLKFTAPTDEGSDDDFATSQLGNAWDMDSTSDIDLLTNVDNGQITSFTMEDAAGTSLGSTRVFYGTSTAAGADCSSVGDPQLELLYNNKRGKTRQIDADRYRLLTVEFGIGSKPRDVNCGSIARVVWRQKGDTGSGSVSDDIIFNSRGGVNLLDKITVDMKNLKVEQGTGAGSTNWVNGSSGGIDIFRFDPHEFGAATAFYVKRVKLADFERAKSTYTIKWTYSKSSGTVDLYYDTTGSGFSGTLITSGLDATAGQYTWNVSSIATSPATTAYIYAIFTDGTNENRVYAPQPLLLDSAYTQKPRMSLNRSTLNFGITNGTTTTGSQVVRVTFSGAGSPPCWVVSNSNANFLVTGASGSGTATGTGNGSFVVSLVSQTWPGAGEGSSTLTVNECTSGTILNPGLTVTATYRITAAPSAPFGAVDTPAEGVTVKGSFGITGWALDDIDISAVNIYRAPVTGESSIVYIGTASRVDDARPDIDSFYSTSPFSYRGGWGYLLLSNFLPGLGDGTYTLYVYATDKDGHQTLLGTRTVTGANSQSTEPFGAIDTPAQGETVSGTVNNFGWVLVRAPANASPADGGTVSAVIDGVIVGNPGQWTSRPDITALFPSSTYNNVNHALGVYSFNSASYSNSVHTISWVVTASNGQAAGIGSRYFTVANSSSSLFFDPGIQANVISARPPIDPGPNVGRKAGEIAALDGLLPIRAHRGYALRPASFTVKPDYRGVRTVHAHTMERVVVDASAAGSHRYEAYLVAGGTLRPLPIGASFDQRRGVLYWQPGVGFVGAYDFTIVRDGRTRVPVRVLLTDAPAQVPVNRFVRGLFTESN